MSQKNGNGYYYSVIVCAGYPLCNDAPPPPEPDVPKARIAWDAPTQIEATDFVVWTAVEEHAHRIGRLTNPFYDSSPEKVLCVGKELADAHEKLRPLGKGVFRRWVKERLAIPWPLVRHLLNTYALFAECSDEQLLLLDVDAMRHLSEQGIPRAAGYIACILAKNGLYIDEELGKKISFDTLLAKMG